ncbi:MAG: LPS assembly lipoprotein LptE [Opitutales bacterium]
MGLALVFAVLGGCGHYRWGPPDDLPFQSVYVPPVTSRAIAPQTVVPTTEALRAEVARNPALTLAASADTADAVLEVHLVALRRERAARTRNVPDRLITVALFLEARATLGHPATGEVWFTDRSFTAEQRADTASGLTQAEYQAMPQLAADLARQIVSTASSLW